MGLFDLFKKNNSGDSSSNKKSFFVNTRYADSSSIDSDERPFYREDSYYTFYSYPDTPMAEKVITFDERKKISYPSSNGLYVAEILLLDYVNKGKYPKPKAGYPGLWWFQYGIRDVGHALKSLADRGFIVLDEETGKYKLTDLGNEELSNNGYVPYMHKSKKKTTEHLAPETWFNVWSINKIIGTKNIDWKQAIIEEENRLYGYSDLQIQEEQKDIPKEVFTSKEIKDYIKSIKGIVYDATLNDNSDFQEEMLGLAYKGVDNDKTALLHLYTSIEKKTDIPAVYREATVILRRYKLYDEELHVINAGLRNIAKGTSHYEKLKERKEKVIALKEKSKIKNKK